MASHEDKAISWGHPSYIWRFGQDRRLAMIQSVAPLAGQLVLDIGCGVGIYMRMMEPLSRAVYGIDVDEAKIREAQQRTPRVVVAAAERLPFAAASFDIVLLHEIIEHVQDDQLALKEACRVLRPGGRAIIFAPNRLYPFETHGVYWGGTYHYGNIPLVNYLPDVWRKRFCPHVRAYTRAGIRALCKGLPCRIIKHTQIYPGYDKIAARFPKRAGLFRRITYFLEHTPLRAFGLSHFVVLERLHHGGGIT